MGAPDIKEAVSEKYGKAARGFLCDQNIDADAIALRVEG
jgi:hypothetical protein